MSVERADLRRCVGCRVCLEICPMDVFRFDEEHKKSVIAYPENCCSCGQCFLYCPTGSLQISNQSHLYPVTGMRALTSVAKNHMVTTKPYGLDRIYRHPANQPPETEE